MGEGGAGIREIGPPQPIACAFEFRGVTKVFPSVKAVESVDLCLRSGEVLALVGENGAGKSTLLRIMNGDYQPDEGTIHFGGETVGFSSPGDAHHLGIRVIYQEPEIVAGLSVAENIYLGELPRRAGLVVDWSALNRRVGAMLADWGFERAMTPQMLAERLTPAQRQLVEILKALKGSVKVLALDEPTSSLTEEDASQLFASVRRLCREGVAVLYVSHRIREVLQLAHRVAVLRDGKLVSVMGVEEATEERVVRQMVGRPVAALYGRASRARSEVVMSVRGLTSSWLKDINFDLHRGEVLGIAGLVGAGRSELAKALYGLVPITAGGVQVAKRPMPLRRPTEALDLGLCYAPEDRKSDALILTRNLRENVSLAVLDRLRVFRVIRRRQERNVVGDLVGQLHIKATSIDEEVTTLSGGNQQKVVLARWLARSPNVLILDEPTRGIDVGAKAEIYRLIDQLAANGVGIMFISSELPELLRVADRILVMQAGRITGQLSAEEATEERVLSLAMLDHLSDKRAEAGETA